MNMNSPILDLYAYAMEDYQTVNAPLIEVRRQYFENPDQADARAHTVRAENGAAIRYRMTPRTFQWRVRGGGAGQHADRTKDGGYALRIFGSDGALFRTEYFDASHRLQKIVYDQHGTLRGEITVGDGCIETSFLLTDEDVYHRQKLVPCPEVPYEPKEAYHRFTKLLGVPPVIAYTPDGVLCYYTEANAARAQRLAAEPPQFRFDVPQPADAAAPESQEPELLPELDSLPEPESPAPPPEQSESPTPEAPDGNNKRYYACGKLQSGKNIGGDTPLPAEMYDALREAIAPQPAQTETREFRTADGDWRIQTTGPVLNYAGAIRSGMRNGFGGSIDPASHSAQVGTWVYDGFCGLETCTADNGAIYARFVDTTQPEASAQTALFRADGALLYSGTVADGCRTGFGTALRGDGSYYVGTWANDQPDGMGVLMTADGALLYQGQWSHGQRCGHGTLYRDGQVSYCGEWAADRCHGAGTLVCADGSRIVGQFAHGAVSGDVTEFAPDGRKRYEGQMADGQYHGHGTLWAADGTSRTGTFARGKLCGAAEETDRAGRLVYRGTFEDGVRSGTGTLYDADGAVQYEGGFAAGQPDGRGKCYADGDLVYAGELRGGVRDGVGAALTHGVPQYFGQWTADQPDGLGVMYRDGEPALAGHFAAGQPDGRVNAYESGQLVREMIYRGGAPEYMIEYGSDAIYAGAVYGGKRSGLGRLLNEYCECVQQGVFQDGAFRRPAQVIPRRLDPLPCPDALRDTPYESIACPADGYILGLPIRDGIYSGQVHDGLPHGRGTIAYADHIYTGYFADGAPSGAGSLYLTNGEVISGSFGDAPDAKRVQCGAVTYAVRPSAAE